jgi:hypothetical protein
MEQMHISMLSVAGAVIILLFGALSKFFWDRIKQFETDIATLKGEFLSITEQYNIIDKKFISGLNEIKLSLSNSIAEIKQMIQSDVLEREKNFIRKEECVFHVERFHATAHGDSGLKETLDKIEARLTKIEQTL